jgi:small subunit ribosomal protein S18
MFAVRNLNDPSSKFLSLDKEAPSHRSDSEGRSNSPTDALRRIYRDGGDRFRRSAERRKKEIVETLRHKAVSEQYLRQMPRRWETGDVYAPHDMSPFEMHKWRARPRPTKDVMDVLGLNPLDLYRVSHGLSTSSPYIGARYCF